jgi:hypothetical protein
MKITVTAALLLSSLIPDRGPDRPGISHLRLPRAMIWPTLQVIEFPAWLAREVHNWRNLAIPHHGYSR